MEALAIVILIMVLAIICLKDGVLRLLPIIIVCISAYIFLKYAHD